MMDRKDDTGSQLHDLNQQRDQASGAVFQSMTEENPVIANQQAVITALEQRVAEYEVHLAEAARERQAQLDRLKRAEEVTRAIGEQVRALFDNHKAIFLLIEPYSGAIVYANASAAQFYGYPHDQMQGMNISAINQLPPDEVKALRLSALQNGGGYIHFPHRLASGEIRTVEVHTTPIEIEGQTLLFSIIHDITERVRAEDALRQAELRYRTIVENAVMGIFQSTPDGRYLNMNAAMARVYGYDSPAEMIEHVGSDISHRIYVDASNRVEFRRRLDTGDVLLGFEAPNYRKDGSVIWTRTNVRAVRDAAGAVLYYEGFLIDITERKRAEEGTRRQAARTAALAHAAARLNAQLDLKSVLQLACDETARALNVPVSWISLYNTEQSTFDFAGSYGLPADFMQRWAPLSRAIFDLHGSNRGGFYSTPDLRERTITDAPNKNLLAAVGVRSILSVTMLRDDQLIGLLSIAATGEGRVASVFSADEKALLKGLSDIAGQAVANARLYEETQRRLRNEQALRTVELAITSSFDPRATLDIIIEQLIAQLKVDAADIMLLDPATRVLHFAAGYGFNTQLIMYSLVPLGQPYAGQAALQMRTIVRNDDVMEHPDLLTPGFKDFLSAEQFKAHIATPLLVNGESKGVLEVFNRTPLAIDAEWLRFLEAFAAHAAMSIVNAALLDGLKHSNADLAEAYDATIEGWSKALDLRDRDTEGHTQRVADTTVKLARAMDIDEDAIIAIRRGALLHDIGKMGVPDDILLKPGPLSEEEWQVMRRHPVYAHQWLKPITFLSASIDIPFCHHEDWDGNGYPSGLQGEEIPLAARIFAVVDAWDALCSDRPYRQAWPVEKVMAYLRKQSGRRFDPKVVELFLSQM